MFTESERVFDAISRYLLEEGLAVGDPVPGELEWVSRLGVGRSTVREALAVLRVLGVIRSRRRGGITVVRNPQILELRQYLSPRYVDEEIFWDACGFRSILERGMSDLILERITDGTRREIRALLDGIRSGTPSSDSVWGWERQFHLLLIRDCRNRLATLLSSLYDPIFEYAKEHIVIDSRAGVSTWLHDHEELADFLFRQDREGFTICLHRHTRRYLGTHGSDISSSE